MSGFFKDYFLKKWLYFYTEVILLKTFLKKQNPFVSNLALSGSAWLSGFEEHISISSALDGAGVKGRT